MGDRLGTAEEQQWPPSRDVIEKQSWVDPADASATRIALIRHPAVPYSGRANLDNFKDVAAVAHTYLSIVTELNLLPIPRWWLDALEPGQSSPKFGWLEIQGPDPGPWLNVASLSVFDLREQDGALHDVNRGLVLLAGELIGGLPLGSEMGLRIMVDAASGDTGKILIRGASVALPYGPYGREITDVSARQFLRERVLVDFFAAEQARIADAAGLAPSTLSLRGIRFVKPTRSARTLAPGDPGKRPVIEARMRGLTPTQLHQPSDAYEIFLRISLPRNRREQSTITITNRVLLSACGVNQKDFSLDPASRGGPALWRQRRPTRSQEALANELEDDQDIPNALQVAGQFDVVQTWFAHDPAAEAVKTVVPTVSPRLRSNDFTAVSAYRNVKALFDRFKLYGLPLTQYFQFADLPLTVKYRFGVRPGPGKDGQTVNGRVVPHPWLDNDSIVNPAAQRPHLEMHLALADLRVRDRDGSTGVSLSYATPLGFADDPRWIWHEFAHVLLMATLGELEFRFAHSMGDGLAAIVADPRSHLSNHPLWRGATYPFVFAPRRHDRCVACGWGWSGLLGRAMRNAPECNRLQRKGYTTEQILSTSLFRMYRCFGGDTVDAAGKVDEIGRGGASDYAVYLIMKALSLLGAPGAVPAEHAEQFVDALIWADVRTSKAVPSANGGSRVGGTTWKTIRWAFEAQGMFASLGNESDPGDPPSVDVFIADRRPTTENFPSGPIHYGQGSYVSVSLDWAGLAAGPGGGLEPKWFADASAMSVDESTVDVTVGNRGTKTAMGVNVRVWSKTWPTGTPAPDWDPNTWNSVTGLLAADIAPGSTNVFANLALPAGSGPRLIMAEAFCAADPANIDPAAGLAPSAGPVPLAELVPLDNNLGLILLPSDGSG